MTPAERTQTGNGLSMLLEAERRLSARLERVVQQADAIVSAAEGEARRRLERLDAELHAEGEALAQAIEAGAANRIEALRREAAASVTRYQGVSDETVLDLARQAVALIVRADDGDGP